MKRILTITFALLLAVSMAGMPLAAATADTTASVQEDDQNSEDIAPGEQLAGVVGVQEAELNGELTERTYGIKIANAQTDDAKADVVGEQLTDVEQRIAILENRTEELNEALEAGEINQGQYKGEMAAIEAERKTTERLANGTATTAGELDEEMLEERGIDAEAIQTLSDRAAELSGPEVAEIAQSIAGEQVGQPADADREPGAPIDLPDREDDDPAPDTNDRDTPGADEDGMEDRDTPEGDEDNADDRDTSEGDEGGADDQDTREADEKDEDERDTPEADEDETDESETTEDDETESNDDQSQNDTGNQ